MITQGWIQGDHAPPPKKKTPGNIKQMKIEKIEHGKGGENKEKEKETKERKLGGREE